MAIEHEAQTVRQAAQAQRAGGTGHDQAACQVAGTKGADAAGDALAARQASGGGGAADAAGDQAAGQVAGPGAANAAADAQGAGKATGATGATGPQQDRTAGKSGAEGIAGAINVQATGQGELCFAACKFAALRVQCPTIGCCMTRLQGFLLLSYEQSLHANTLLTAACCCMHLCALRGSAPSAWLQGLRGWRTPWTLTWPACRLC